MSEKLGAIILAAGKGKRMQSKDTNKVALKLGGKPIILHAVHLFQKMKLAVIVIVVGHAKHSVINAVSDDTVIFAEQKEQLGTGDALKVALEKIPEYIHSVLVVGGDDSYLYTQDLITKLQEKHFSAEADITLLTIQVKDPFGLGRIIRNVDGQVTAIIEEKDATESQRIINEVNPGCYIFKTDFLKEYLKLISKSSVTGEYYLTSLVEIAIKNKKKIASYNAGYIPWRGINTPEELEHAQKLMSN